MTRPLACFVLSLALAGCGADEAVPPTATVGHWKHCTVEGLASAGGLTIYGDDLIAVASGNDRRVYTLARKDLAHGARLRARTLRVDTRPDATLLGAEPFALQGYTLKHLWALPVDFHGVAVQAPDFLYVGERTRRVVFWGRLVRDAAGRLDSVRFSEVSIAPGAVRSNVAQGDWRDYGPGLAGLLALSERRRVEDLYVLDRKHHAGAYLRIYRMDRYGSKLGEIHVRHPYFEKLACNALSWDGRMYVVHQGKGRGGLESLREPDGPRSTRMASRGPGPDVAGVETWTGMAHAPDGTVYLVSDGEPAIVAWRAP